MNIDKVKAEFSDQGYSIVDDAFSSDLVDRLETAARNVWNKVRCGEVDVANNGPEAGAIFGLLAPEFGEPVFGEHFLAPTLTPYVEAFLGPELRLGYVHLRNAAGSYDTGWHRDVGDSSRDLPYEEEMNLLSGPMTALRWQLALLDDPCLWLVPHSQRRYRTDEEREALVVDRHMDIAGMENLMLKRGQTLFWDGNTIHRGILPPALNERLVLAGGLCKYQRDELLMDLDERFRWRMADNIGLALPDKVRLWWERWLSLQKVSGPC